MKERLRGGDSGGGHERGRWRPFRGWWLASSLLCICVVIVGAVIGYSLEISGETLPTINSASVSTRAHSASVSAATPSPSRAILQQPTRCACASLRLGERVTPQPPADASSQGGQVIVVSLSQQWLWAFQNHQLVFETPVTTGRPALPTPLGVYPLSQKESNVTFYSPWPPGSPYYYSPLHIDYAMLFRAGGYYIHDAPWRRYFGPGTNVSHTNPDGTQDTGSHGCVEVPVAAGAWLYRWSAVGATIKIVR